MLKFDSSGIRLIQLIHQKVRLELLCTKATTMIIAVAATILEWIMCFPVSIWGHCSRHRPEDDGKVL